MKTKNIELMRQVRLMTVEVVVPLVTAGVALDCAHPEYKKNLAKKAKEFKNSVTSKFKKKSN